MGGLFSHLIHFLPFSIFSPFLFFPFPSLFNLFRFHFSFDFFLRFYISALFPFLSRFPVSSLFPFFHFSLFLSAPFALFLPLSAPLRSSSLIISCFKLTFPGGAPLLAPRHLHLRPRTRGDRARGRPAPRHHLLHRRRGGEAHAAPEVTSSQRAGSGATPPPLRRPRDVTAPNTRFFGVGGEPLSLPPSPPRFGPPHTFRGPNTHFSLPPHTLRPPPFGGSPPPFSQSHIESLGEGGLFIFFWGGGGVEIVKILRKPAQMNQKMLYIYRIYINIYTTPPQTPRYKCNKCNKCAPPPL